MGTAGWARAAAPWRLDCATLEKFGALRLTTHLARDGALVTASTSNQASAKLTAETLIEHLAPPEDLRLRLEQFPRGIDNVHIDVVLGQRFVVLASQLVRRLLSHEVSVNLWGEAPAEPGVDDVEAFARAYISLTEVAVDQARQSGRRDLIVLFQLSVTKFLLQLVGDEIARMRARLRRARDEETGGVKVSALEVHQRVVALARDRQAIRYKLNRELFRHVHKLESTRLRKLRKAVLAASWPVPKHLMLNPMLLLPGIMADEQAMVHYNLMFTERDAPGGFSRINPLITGLLRGLLPGWAVAPAAGESAVSPGLNGPTSQVTFRQRTDQGSLSGFLEAELLLTRSIGEEECAHDLTSWLDVPENLDRMFLPAGGDRAAPGRSRHRLPDPWREYLVSLGRKLYWRFWRAGLLPSVMASYEVRRVHEELQGKVPARLIFQYLARMVSRRKLVRRLSGSQVPMRPQDALVALERGRQRLRRMTRTDRFDRLMQFLRDFAVFRRDLKCAYVAYRAMDRIRLLESPEDIALSKANGTLQQFLDAEERRAQGNQVRSHVIIKADVRGSARMTEELLERKLNPATHFSLNFFGPITALLEDFGATKVFVEGDAVILSLLEHDESSPGRLNAAQACGLARKMLAVVDAQNAQNRKHDLPGLEIGLGITYADGPPTYLYDGDREIMISSAINRADQLSSCSPALRKAPLCTNRGGRGIEVAVVAADEARSCAGETLLRYNVDGVELEQAAFQKLKRELALRRVEVILPGDIEATRFYVTRYPDRKGMAHWLAVREAPIRCWRDGQLGEPDPSGRCFYEVITDASVLALIKRRVGTRQARDAARTAENKLSGQAG